MGVGLSLDQLTNWAANQADKTTKAYFQKAPGAEGTQPLTATQITNVHGVPQAEATHVVNALSNAQGITSGEACKNARKTFLSFIKRECGLPDTASIKELPQNVQTAMKCTGFGGLYHRLADWGKNSSHPLTARRILAVTTAIREFQESHSLEKCAFFSKTSFEGLAFMRTWNVTDKEPFGGATSNMKLYLNLFNPEDYKAVGAALNLFGPKCRPNMLYDIKLHLNEIKEAVAQGPLTAVKLFEKLRPNKEVPAALSAAVASKDLQGISSALIAALDCDLESWAYAENSFPKGTPEYEKRHLASQLLGKFPYFTTLSDLQAAMGACINGSANVKEVTSKMVSGLAEFGLGINSGVKTAGNAVLELYRFQTEIVKVHMSFTNSSGKTTKVAFVGKKGVSDIEANVTDFSSNVRKGLGQSDDYMFGMVMASFMQQGISTFRQLGQVECGFIPSVRTDALRYQVTQNHDGSMTVEIQSNLGRVDAYPNEETGKNDFYDVDIYCKYTLYPDGSQKVDPNSHWHMTLNPTAEGASSGSAPEGFTPVDFEIPKETAEAS